MSVLQHDRKEREEIPYVKQCVACKEFKQIPMTGEQAARLLEGLLSGVCIQDAVPDLSRGWREMFISGICPDCWEKMFGPEPE